MPAGSRPDSTSERILVRVQETRVLVGLVAVDSLPGGQRPQRIVGLFDYVMKLRDSRGLQIGESFHEPVELLVPISLSGSDFFSIYWTLAFAGCARIAVAIEERRYDTRALAFRRCTVAHPVSYVEVGIDSWRFRNGPTDNHSAQSGTSLETFEGAADRLGLLEKVIVHPGSDVPLARLEAFMAAVKSGNHEIALSQRGFDADAGDSSGSCEDYP